MPTACGLRNQLIVVPSLAGLSIEIVLMRRSSSLGLIVAEGWDVCTPTSPLFSEEEELSWQQLSRDVREWKLFA